MKAKLPPGSKSLGINLEALGIKIRPEDSAMAKIDRSSPRYTKPGDDGMNATERAYAAHLEMRRIAGEIFRWESQAFKLLIVPHIPKRETTEAMKGSWYTPDFIVFENDGTTSFHDVKGYLDRSGEAWLKFKAAVAKWPYAFYIVKKVSKSKGSWEVSRFQR